MKVELPPVLESLIATLTSQCGWILDQGLISGPFGDLALTLRYDNLRMRLVRDRDQWFIEFSEKSLPSEWYDPALIKEVLTGSIGQDVLSLDQQVTIVAKDWPKVVELFRGDR